MSILRNIIPLTLSSDRNLQNNRKSNDTPNLLSFILPELASPPAKLLSASSITTQPATKCSHTSTIVRLNMASPSCFEGRLRTPPHHHGTHCCRTSFAVSLNAWPRGPATARSTRETTSLPSFCPSACKILPRARSSRAVSCAPAAILSIA